MNRSNLTKPELIRMNKRMSKTTLMLCSLVVLLIVVAILAIFGVKQQEEKERQMHVEQNHIAMLNIANEIRTELYDEFDVLNDYWYVFRDADPDKGVDVSLIEYVDAICMQKNINSHLIFAMMWVESRFDVTAHNSKSTARGLGQLLEGTARDVYENYMDNGEGSYDHDMAYDPYTNADIMTSYFAYLREHTDGTNEAIMERYSGKKDGNYWNIVKTRMANLSLDTTVNTYTK